MNLTRGINLRKIAELMPGSSGAEVKVLYITLMIKKLIFFFGKNIRLQAETPDLVEVSLVPSKLNSLKVNK